MRAGWHDHPGVRAGQQLTYGERAADRLRNGMGSWAFVLSCLAALQGAILLIAAKRSDQIASELAHHDYHADVKAEKLVEKLGSQFEHMAAQHEALHRQVAELTAALHATSGTRPAAPRQAETSE
jgi:uncharacterized membrane protein